MMLCQWLEIHVEIMQNKLTNEKKNALNDTTRQMQIVTCNTQLQCNTGILLKCFPLIHFESLSLSLFSSFILLEIHDEKNDKPKRCRLKPQLLYKLWCKELFLTKEEQERKFRPFITNVATDECFLFLSRAGMWNLFSTVGHIHHHFILKSAGPAKLLILSV